MEDPNKFLLQVIISLSAFLSGLLLFLLKAFYDKWEAKISKQREDKALLDYFFHLLQEACEVVEKQLENYTQMLSEIKSNFLTIPTMNKYPTNQVDRFVNKTDYDKYFWVIYRLYNNNKTKISSYADIQRHISFCLSCMLNIEELWEKFGQEEEGKKSEYMKWLKELQKRWGDLAKSNPGLNQPSLTILDPIFDTIHYQNIDLSNLGDFHSNIVKPIFINVLSSSQSDSSFHAYIAPLSNMDNIIAQIEYKNKEYVNHVGAYLPEISRAIEAIRKHKHHIENV